MLICFQQSGTQISVSKKKSKTGQSGDYKKSWNPAESVEIEVVYITIVWK